MAAAAAAYENVCRSGLGFQMLDSLSLGLGCCDFLWESAPSLECLCDFEHQKKCMFINMYVTTMYLFYICYKHVFIINMHKLTYKLHIILIYVMIYFYS